MAEYYSVFDVALYIYTVCVGMTVGGILASGYKLFTNKMPSFERGSEPLPIAIALVAVLIFAGPFILMRNTIRSRRLEGRPMPYVAAAGAALASVWCFFSGIFVLAVALNVA